jgi:AcrR family transcriptional regulator
MNQKRSATFENVARGRADVPSTRDRLKLAARRLFAERGIEGTTVRDILTAAGEKNGASLNYYFGAKDELIREITVDMFTLMDERWRRGLNELDQADQPATLRDYVRLLVRASDTSDVEEVPTTARFAQAVSQQRYPMVLSVLKEHNLRGYDQVLARIAHTLPDLPPEIRRQRLVLLTRYLSTIFSLSEIARTSNLPNAKLVISTNFDAGNLIDTAVGLLTASVADAVH